MTTTPGTTAGGCATPANNREGRASENCLLSARYRFRHPAVILGVSIYRGQYCYVAALLPGHREPAPILRLRYQGSADHWAIGIYKASTGQYTETELPGSFGPAAGTPEQGIDDTFILYAGPRTGN
jgi:hypothetical protein